MKLKTLTLFIAILLSSGIVFGEIVATMDEVMKPTTIVIDKDQIYLVEKTTIYIYDAKTYKFKKKFGKQGEGPGEFNFFASILPYRDQLLINSFGKISYYSRQGDMIREQKIKSSMAAPSVMLFPVKDGFVGRGTRFKDKEYYQTINLFDKELNKQKELNSLLVATRGGGKINILSRSLAYQSYKDKIYISGKRGLSIDVLDSSGKKMSTISKADYQPRKFTSEDEATMRREMKKGNPRQYEAIKKRLVFPEYYPDILNMFFANDKLYVATWKWKQDKIEFFVFSPEGKLLKHRYIPFKFMDGLQPYPAAIMNDKLYQLIENEDTEEWELHINPIQ